MRGSVKNIGWGGGWGGEGVGTTPDQAVRGGGVMFYFFPSRSIQRRRRLQTKELLGGHETVTGKMGVGGGPRKRNPQILTDPRTELKMTGPNITQLTQKYI